jgi:hypothetical protein
MADHSRQVYAEVYGSKGSDSGPYGFKVYHYDATGNREIVLHRSGLIYRDKTDAENAAYDYAEQHEDMGIEVM